MDVLTKANFSSEINEREKANLKIAYNAACESIVLLKNNGALPLKDNFLAVYGSGASRTVKGGTGSGEVNERESISVLQGLMESGINITTMPWIDDYEKECKKAEAKFAAKQRLAVLKLGKGVNALFANPPIPGGRLINKKDLKRSGNLCALYVISRQAGEGIDRSLAEGDYYLSKREIENIRFCAENYHKLILLINSGAPVDTSFLDEIPGVDAILYMSQLGTAGGRAVADVLLGKVIPSAKLADSWPMKYDDIPFAKEFSSLNGNVDNEYYKEGIYVGYRYFDSFNVAPRFPFGYGLSYTEFSIYDERVALNGTEVTVTAKVKNIGKEFSGKEILELYASSPKTGLNKAYQCLVAFNKTSLLSPKASETIEMHFDIKALASYNEERAAFVLEKGEYILRLGTSSRDTRAIAVLNLENDYIVSKHKHICALHSPFSELKSPDYILEDTVAIPHYELDLSSLTTEVHTYSDVASDDLRAGDFVNALSVDEMIDIVVGIGQFGGETRFDLPGSVGNTTSKLWEKGLANVTLCDGPAGLRIQRRSVLTADGIKPLDLPSSLYKYLPSFVQKAITADEKDGNVLYQYTTAFPVASALAQSWNTDLLYEVGTAVLAEMKEYGCTYWLAPAINIHRNPLCGRHFEYFSEDPMLTASLASAMIKGVQQEEGYYVTIKHFACNNQEENRNAVSANVSERALREIYLRAFEGCIKSAGAKAVMTSYNKLNGVYTPDSHDLCMDVLRNEWGFKGIVMTDWFATNKAKFGSAKALKAGNDMIMPGGINVKLEIKKALKQGLLSEAELKRCAINVVSQILNSNIQKEFIDK